MDIKTVENSVHERCKAHTFEEAEKIMGRIRNNLFDLLCRSEQSRFEMITDLRHHEDLESIRTAMGKAIVNLFALGGVYGVLVTDAILKELGLPGTPDLFLHDQSSEVASQREKTVQSTEAANAAETKGLPVSGPAPDQTSGYEQIWPPESSAVVSYTESLKAARSSEERKQVWKRIQADKDLVREQKAALYNEFTALNKK